MGENAMLEIGVRELKARASEIIRTVREKRARYLITYRGKPVAILMPLGEARPLEQAGTDEQQGEVWEELTELGQQIGSGWQSDLTAAELLSEMRR
jgi:prevent-host-death family protein